MSNGFQVFFYLKKVAWRIICFRVYTALTFSATVNSSKLQFQTPCESGRCGKTSTFNDDDMCPCLLCNARPSKTRGALQRSVAGKSSNNGWRRFAPFRVYSKLAKLHYAELWWYDELNDHSFPHWIAIGSTLRCADILAGGRWRAKILHLESQVQMTQHFHFPFALDALFSRTA